MIIEVDLDSGFVDVLNGATVVSRFILNDFDEDTINHVVNEVEDLLKHLNVKYETIYI